MSANTKASGSKVSSIAGKSKSADKSVDKADNKQAASGSGNKQSAAGGAGGAAGKGGKSSSSSGNKQ